MQNRTLVRKMCVAAMIAALYTALTLCLAPFSFGAVQCRPAEAMTVLAVVTPAAIPGLTIGCALSNLVGYGMGANVAGLADVFIGSFATFSAALLSRRLRRFKWGGIPWLSTLPPVIINAVAVGAELTFVSPAPTLAMFWTQAGLVALGQVIACVIGGALLYRGLCATGKIS